MNSIPLSTIAHVAGGTLRGPHGVIRGIKTDARRVGPGDLYIALRGARFDGTVFIEQARRRGARAALVPKGYRQPISQAWSTIEASPLVALGSISAWYRRLLGATVIGITGSAGKTTTKDFLSTVLRTERLVVAARASHNNHIGVPLTLLSGRPNTQVIITEMGTNAPGEIRDLATLASPEIGIITGIGASHLAGLGTISMVREEKADLARSLPTDGTLFVNGDCPESVAIASDHREQSITVGESPQSDIVISDIHFEKKGSRFTVLGTDFYLPIRGRHNVGNAALAIAVADQLGVTPKAAARQLATATPRTGRMRTHHASDITVIDDAYNANPMSVTAAIDTLSVIPAQRRAMVLGPMAELGPASGTWHRRMGERAAKSGVDLLVCVGTPDTLAAGALDAGLAPHQCVQVSNARAAADATLAWLRPGDALIVKASRSARLERVVHHLLNEIPERFK